MGYYIGQNGIYYEGDKADWRDKEVPRRPDYLHRWDGKAWVIDEAKVKSQESAELENKIEVEKQSILREQAIKRLVDREEITAKQAEKLTGVKI